MRKPEMPAEGSAPDPEESGEHSLDRRRVRPSAAWNLTVITAAAAADDAAAAAEAAVDAVVTPACAGAADDDVPAPEGAMPRCVPHDARPHEHARRALRKGSAQARG